MMLSSYAKSRICTGLAAVATSEVNYGYLFKLAVLCLLPPSKYAHLCV